MYNRKVEDACEIPRVNKTLNIYKLDHNEELFEVPGENLVFKLLSVCDRSTVSCYGQNLLCTPSRYTIILQQEAKVEGEKIEGSLEILSANLRFLEQAVTALVHKLGPAVNEN